LDDNSEAEPLDKLFNTLETHIQTLNPLLFPDGSDAGVYSWIHAMLWKLSKVNVIANRAAVQNALQGLCQTYIDPLALLMEFDQTCRSQLSGILSELQASETSIKRSPSTNLAVGLLALPRTLYDMKNQLRDLPCVECP
jgi:hypothetical protein